MHSVILMQNKTWLELMHLKNMEFSILFWTYLGDYIKQQKQKLMKHLNLQRNANSDVTVVVFKCIRYFS